MNLHQRNRLVRAINRVRRAEIADCWKGAGDPADIPQIEADLKSAKKHLNEVLDELTLLPTDTVETRRRKLNEMGA